MSSPPEICHDYTERDGCTMVADPKNTLIAAEHGHPESEDLHFCNHCKLERERFCNEVMKMIADDWFSEDELREEIHVAKVAAGNLKS